MTRFAGVVQADTLIGGGLYGIPHRGEAWFVDTNQDSGDGRSWDGAFKTMSEAFDQVGSNDTIYFVGNVREQLTSPDGVFDVTIIGASNRPRNSDAHGTNVSQRSATWRGPASAAATTPLLLLRHQGWTLANILFNAPTDDAAVALQRNALTGADEDDASHTSFIGCRFDGGHTGIEDEGGNFNVLVDDCLFIRITGGTGVAIHVSSIAVALPLNWLIRRSRFLANDNDIIAAASGWNVEDNIFDGVGTDIIDFGGGAATNIVTKNLLGGTFSIAGGYISAGAGDQWMGNFADLAGGVTQADPA